jgi:hypothetical protein
MDGGYTPPPGSLNIAQINHFLYVIETNEDEIAHTH